MKRFAFIIPFLILPIAGCEDDSPTTPPAVPTAAFTVAGTQQAGQAVRFDASGSTDPGGGGLSYSWSFGDGTHGGTREIAHLYALGGAYTARVTVRDGVGNTATATQTVTIAPGPVATGTADVAGRVFVLGGAPLPGVTVSVAGAQAQTNAQGLVTLGGVPAGVPLVLRLSQPGYAEGIVRLAALNASSADAYFEASLVPRSAAVTLASADAGGTAAGPGGTRVTFPAAALVRADGSAATGAVDVAITPVDVSAHIDAFPGTFAGVEPNGTRTAIATLGVMEVVLSQGGQPLQVAPGQSATVEIPIYTGGAVAGQSIPLWSLDEGTGVWVQEGTGTVVSSAGSPTGLALRAMVSHFTWWNVDVPYGPFTANVRCYTKDAAGNLVPAMVGCWVRARQPPGPGPVASDMVMLQPFERRPLPLFPNVATSIEGAAFYGGAGSVTVTGAAGTSQNVDVVLAQPTAPPPAGDVRLVVVGAHSSMRILASQGAEWYPTPSPMTAGYTVAWNGSRWVAGGGFGGVRIATSVDGFTWLPAVSVPASITHVRALAWNGSMWVAGGGASGSTFSALATSPDGLTWTARQLPPNGGPVTSVAWNGAYWLAGMDNVGLLRSSDGISWQVQPAPLGTFPTGLDVAWSGTRWVAAAHGQGGSIIVTSTDGVTWDPHTPSIARAQSVAWNGSYWLVGGQGGIATSATGTSWTSVAVPGVFDIHDVAWTGSAWVGVATGSNSGMVLTSGDAVAWTVSPLPLAHSGRGVAYRRPLYPPFPAAAP